MKSSYPLSLLLLIWRPWRKYHIAVSMNRALMLFPILVALGAARPGPAPQHVDYTLSPLVIDGALRSLGVEVRFSASATGSTGFGWQPGWGGSETLGDHARDLTVDGAKTVTPDGKHHVRIVAVPGAAITVRYRIVSGYDTYPNLPDFDRTVPVIRPTWFSALGYAVFGFPDGDHDRPATFLWIKGPAGVPLVSDLQHLSSFRTSERHLGTVGDVLNSTLVGGSGVTVYDDDKETGLRVAAIPGAVPSTNELYRVARQIAVAERRFWKDEKARPYVITASPVPRKPGSIFLSGANFTDAFGLWLNEDAGPADIAFLLAHEYAHNWIPGALGRGYRDDGQEQREAWLGEGFTDYFALATALGSGAIDLAAFSDAWNRILSDYATSPRRNMPGNVAAKAFFTDRAAEKLPYQRGALLAARWSAYLRPQPKKTDLRHILLTQVEVAKRSAATPAPLFMQVARVHGLSVAADIRRFIDQGATIMLAPDTFGPCARIVTERRPVFDRGYDATTTAAANNVVTGVAFDSNAYRAGLRDGMTITTRRSGKAGDAMTPFSLAIRDRTDLITYLPQGRAMVTVQQMRLVPGLTRTCRASLSGMS